jgi:SAM-dependent methyltransferase
MASREELEERYAGEAGRFWSRVEGERPASYWERNLIDARRLARRLIAGWLDPLTDEKVLDAGCGSGSVARYLASRGAKVLAVDALPRFVPAAGDERLHFAVADLRQRPVAAESFTSAILHDVLGDYPARDRVALFQSLAEWRCRRVVLVMRQSSPWGEWVDGLAAPEPHEPVDTVKLFRGIHLETPYFLTRRETIRRRNASLEVAEFSLSQHWPGV